MKNKLNLLFLIFLFTNSLFSQNLIVNGGFESGGSGLGFVTNGAGYTLLNTPYSGTTTTGNFAFTTNPNLINTANFLPSSDHTTGSGRMLIIDGNTNATSPRFWKAGNTGAGITTLVIGTTYRFSYWIKSVSSLVTGPASQANIVVQVTGGSGLTLVAGSTLAPLPALGWRHVVYSFTATATTATIELWNTNTSSVGNDFAVDDFMLTSTLMVTYNVTDALCASANDGSITVGGIGGTLPYSNYTISGPVSQNNATGIFTGLPPGIYTVSVTDSALPLPSIATMANAVVGPSLATSSNVAICLGNSTTLSVSGSPNGYTWTSAPVDATLTNPNSSNPTVTPAVTTVYTVSSTNGACNLSKSVTVTVNPLPVANITGNATICPGNTAVITITGTPSSTVTFVNNLGNSYSPFIPASGTLAWTTPILNATTIYTLVSVKNFASFCQRNYTGVAVTITVVPNGCATVGTLPGSGSLPLDLTLCTSGECRVIQANISNVPSTSTYAASSIPYCPYPFTDPSYNVVPITGGDDFWSDVINLPFDFCFYGENYTSCNAGTNGLITFDPKTPGAFCPWPDTSVPITGQNQTKSIFGVYQDTDMAIPPSAANRQVNWVLQGTYPCRKLIVNFYNLGQWNSVGSNPGLQTSQIVLYEVSNIIEVFVQRRVAGSPWAGSGAIGLIGGTPAQWVAAPGRNTGNWSVTTSEAWRFTPTGPNVPVVINWFAGATPIGTGPSITVCPTADTTYTANAIYNVCGVSQTATTSVNLRVNPDLTNAPVNITQCSNTFNLTTNASVILGALNPSDYDISYHLSATDAAAVSNPIANPSAFVSSGQTIYVAIYLNTFGCTVVKPFNLIISCGTISPVPDLTLCESSLGSGTAVFNLTPQTAIALGGENPADYTITYYLSQAAANAGIAGTEINPINSFIGTNQTLYIRMQNNANPVTFYTTDFDLIVNSIANAGTDGSITICNGNTTSVNLFNLITGEQTGGIWTQTSGTGGTFNAAAGTFTPTAGTTSSTFTYTIDGIAPCADDTSIATINIIPQPSAGTDGGTVICASSNTPIDLFSLITGEQTGGTWTQTTGTGGIFNAGAGTFAPTAGATSSTFTYTVNGIAPCVNDSSIATVTIGSQPNAGTDGATTVCETSVTAINLSSLITGEQAGGVWTQTSGTGGTFNAAAGTFTPSVGATTSSFTYTLSGVAPCITDTSLATVNIISQPSAGIDGGTVVCETSSIPLDLFSVITGEQSGGIWVRTSGTGGVFNAAAGTYTPAIGATTSTFTYTVAGVAPCGNDSSVATVTINSQPNAGTDGATTVCETSVTAINLSSLITGEQAGGVWTQTAGTGGTFNATGGTFTPSVGATSSIFTYTLIGVAPCSNDTSLVAVTINPQPTAGTDGGTVVCETSTTAVDLFSLITGEQTGGNWVRTSGTGGVFNSAAGTYTPAIGATTSTFTYTLTGTAPCINDSSLATITINSQPTAGNDGGTTICENDSTPINLYTLITGEQAGGTWTRTTGTGGAFNATTGIFTPALGVTTSTFTYTVIGTAPCVNDSSIVTIAINPLPTATISGTTAVCLNSTSPQIILTGANGTAPYTFTYSINTVVQPTIQTTAGNSVAVNVPTASQGVYTYAIVSIQDGNIPSCSQSQSDSAVVTVNTAPTINTPTSYVVCDDSLNNDGLYCFDLTTKIIEITGGDPTVVVDFYETTTSGVSQSSPYCSITPGVQTLDVRAHFIGSSACYSTTSLNLVVNPIPLPNPIITDYELCDYNNPGDGVE
ncbi:beta strand repeat-containing protein, partial [Flavobacterium paronense]